MQKLPEVQQWDTVDDVMVILFILHDPNYYAAVQKQIGAYKHDERKTENVVKSVVQ